jgi:hypothetical protein
MAGRGLEASSGEKRASPPLRAAPRAVAANVLGNPPQKRPTGGLDVTFGTVVWA